MGVLLFESIEISRNTKHSMYHPNSRNPFCISYVKLQGYTHFCGYARKINDGNSHPVCYEYIKSNLH